MCVIEFSYSVNAFHKIEGLFSFASIYNINFVSIPFSIEFCGHYYDFN